MTKELKKCYYYLDLPFSATIEEVQTQEKMFIKILRAKAFKTGKSSQKKINKIVHCANCIQESIKKYGIPNKKECQFKSSNKDLITQLIILLALSIVAVVSYLCLV